MQRDPWFGVELRHLAALQAVAREGSFHGAADSLGYVQSAVSQQLAQLERIVGARLVERARGGRETRLTAEGRVLVEHAEEILARLHAARSELAARSGRNGARPVKVGFAGSVGRRLLPELLSRVREAAPDVNVTAVALASDSALAEQTARVELDFALGNLPVGSSSLAHCTIAWESCVLVVPADSPLAGCSWPSVEELTGLPLIELGGWSFGPALRAWFAAQGTEPRFVAVADDDATAQALVAAGVGSAILPDGGVHAGVSDIATVQLDGLLPRRRVGAFWNGAATARQSVEQLRRAALAMADAGLRRRAAQIGPGVSAPRSRATPPRAVAARAARSAGSPARCA
jgi:molybdate transport repressor ModE-like protein